MTPPEQTPRPVHPTVVWLASYAWRIIAISIVGLAALWVVGQVRVTLLALIVATLLSRALMPASDLLRRRGLPPAAAAALTLVGFLATFGLVMTLIGIGVVNSAEDIGPTVTEAIDDIETWVVEDSPFDVDQEDVDEFRANLGSDIGRIVSSGDTDVAAGVFAAFETIFALLLGLVLTFFFVKDGRRFGRALVEKASPERRPVAKRMLQRAWDTIGGYLRGAAILGVVEGTIIALTMWIVGSELAVPMGTLTFLGAFVPFVGAVVAGVLAVLVTLATAGFGGALIVAGVAVAVQQLDNDLLAPWIYGKALSLHPVVVLLAITSGGSLFGLLGTFLAVPVTAVLINVWSEARRVDSEAAPGIEPG